MRIQSFLLLTITRAKHVSVVKIESVNHLMLLLIIKFAQKSMPANFQCAEEYLQVQVLETCISKLTTFRVLPAEKCVTLLNY